MAKCPDGYTAYITYWHNFHVISSFNWPKDLHLPLNVIVALHQVWPNISFACVYVFRARPNISYFRASKSVCLRFWAILNWSIKGVRGFVKCFVRNNRAPSASKNTISWLTLTLFRSLDWWILCSILGVGSSEIVKRLVRIDRDEKEEKEESKPFFELYFNMDFLLRTELENLQYFPTKTVIFSRYLFINLVTSMLRSKDLYWPIVLGSGVMAAA